jgi:hypothetical protein
MEFILNEYHLNTPEEELLDDLKKTAKKLGKKSLSFEEYNAVGKFAASTLARRFRAWNSALGKAGLEINHRNDVGEDELFDNMKRVWIKLKRQPVMKDMKKPQSEFSYHCYIRRFVTWRKALKALLRMNN